MERPDSVHKGKSGAGNSRFLALRSAIMRSLILVGVVFALLFTRSNDLYEWLSAPIRASLPEGATMIATEVTSTFFAPFKLAIIAAFVLCMPYMITQAYRLIHPDRPPRLAAWLLIALSVVLFYAGMAFAFLVAFPLIMGFFSMVGPANVLLTPDINSYMDIALKLLFAFGMTFEIPVITVVLVRVGVVELETLRAKRSYVFLGCFVVGMLLTPPDMFSQTLLAVPMWLLFELGLVLCRWLPAQEHADSEQVSLPDSVTK